MLINLGTNAVGAMPESGVLPYATVNLAVDQEQAPRHHKRGGSPTSSRKLGIRHGTGYFS
jgi:hypothetical protein